MMHKTVTTLAMLSLASVALGAMTVQKRIAGADGGWDYASVDAGSNRLFVARTDGVMTVDLATGAVTPQLVATGRTHAAFVIPGTSTGVVTSTVAGGALLFDAVTGAVAATIKTGAKPDAALYDPATRMVYVMDNSGGTVSIIDPKAAALVGTIMVGGALEFAALDGHGHLFVNVEDRNELVMIDLATRKVMRRTALTGCDEPSGLATTKGGVLISACANGVAKTIDARSGRLLADITIGLHPDAVMYDAARDRAYIPSGGDGTLTVIDTTGKSTPRAVAVVATQKGSRTGAVDPATGTVYLPGARFAAAVGSERPKAVPGSFEVLAVRP
ncbi:YncE family protein [Sphingosinicellaceae bacterium]|nr:YncE family protein [Sphingosinicellaceae bacterium]